MEEKKPQVNNDSYPALAQRLLHLNSEYGDLPIESVFGAWQNAGGMNFMLQWPEIQNQRVKGINTHPANYSKQEIADFLEHPENSEKQLRAVSSALSFSAKTYDLILQTYQDILTYDWYVYPTYSLSKIDKDTQTRDLLLAEKVAKAIDIKKTGHELVGLCMQYGKVFVTPRVSVDKSHNKVNYAFLQQLPTDYCKIVGYNNGPGKYTVAFNMMYFLRPGTTPAQFGDLFYPYLDMFGSVVDTSDSKYVYASVNVGRFNALHASESIGNPQWAQIGREFAYWVTLPADKVFVFEINDRNPEVVPNTTGLMVSMVQIPDYEAAQMQIVLNPLTSIMSGELETYSTNGVPNADPIAVSPSVRRMFENFWYEMLARNNTSGIGLFLAPARNLKLQTISDTVSNTNIATTAVADQVQKAGLASVIPTTNDPKVGVAEISAKINAELPKAIYRTLDGIMNWLFETSIGLKTPIRFRSFGDIFSREKELENCRKGMECGILLDTIKYDAMVGHTLMDDIAISDFVYASGVLDKRIPLTTSYSAKQDDGNATAEVKHDLNPGGRPAEDGSQNSQKTETTTIV